jgi:hypothetical protein
MPVLKTASRQFIFLESTSETPTSLLTPKKRCIMGFLKSQSTTRVLEPMFAIVMARLAMVVDFPSFGPGLVMRMTFSLFSKLAN